MKKTILILFLLFTSLSFANPVYPDRFLNALKIVLKFEGGYLAEEQTYKGVRQTSYNAYRLSKHLPMRDVREITTSELNDCYYLRYYKKGKCDSLPEPLMAVHLDACINFGVEGAHNLLEKVYERGQGLIAKAQAVLYCDIRIEQRYDIVNRKPVKKKFLKGWIKRDNRLKKIIQNQY